MDAAESCHIVGIDDDDHDQQVPQINIRSHDDDTHLDEATYSIHERRIAALNINNNNNKKSNESSTTTTLHSPTTVYLTGMPLRYCTETVIEKMMTRYGKIARCTVHTQQSNKVFAFCEFIDASSAAESIRALNGRKLGGQNILVRPAFKEGGSVPSSVGKAMASSENSSNPKRLRQQLDSKIEAIQRKLAKKAFDCKDI